MQCGRCGVEARVGVAFCEACGGRLAGHCAACGAVLPGGSRFCGACGARVDAAAAPGPPAVPPEGERKRVTVLFCDIVGSTGLAERIGDEPMHELLDRFFRIAVDEVHRYGGTVHKFLGDGFMALLGVPQAEEDHARRAVMAALGLRRRLGEDRLAAAGEALAVRVGLNSGLVVVGALGDERQADYTAVGDTANVAARLQAAAQPGEILMGEATRRLAPEVRAESVGPVELRGRLEPIVAYRVHGVSPRRSPLAGMDAGSLSSFEGRERELGTLRDLVRRTLGSRGQAVGIVGEPGMGKSRLLLELRRFLAGERVTYLEGRCLSYGASTPYLPLRDVLRANCGIARGDDAATVAGRVRLALAEIGLGESWAPYLLNLLGSAADREALDDLSPEALKERTFEAVRLMCLHGSARRPLVLAVEDLHWADPTSGELVTEIAEALSAAPILLVATYRPGHRPAWLERSWATQLTLGPLGPDESLGVVRSVLRGDRGAGVPASAIVSRAGGNPFFLEELARAAGEAGSHGMEVPDTVQGVLAARIDRLDEMPRRTLRTAAVLGREFTVRLLGEVWDGAGPVELHLAALRRADFLHERAGLPAPAYAFTHALVQDVAYEGLLTARRRRLHEEAGRALERIYAGREDEVRERLAHHFSRAGRADRAVEHLARLAESSAARYAHEEAVRALGEALGHAPALDGPGGERRRVELTLALVRSHYFLGRLEEGAELLAAQEERVARLEDPRLLAEHRFWVAHTLSHLSDPEGAERSAALALDGATALGDAALAGKAAYMLTRECWWTGRFEQGIAHGDRAAASLERAGERFWLGHCLCYAAHNRFSRGEVAAALAVAARARDLGEASGDPRLRSFAAWTVGWYRAASGEPEAGLADCREALRLSPDPVNTAWATGFLGFALLQSGDADAAAAHLEASVRDIAAARHPRLGCWFGGWLAEAYLAAARPAEARSTAEAALGTAEALAVPWAAARARRTLGRIALKGGDPAASADALGAALACEEALGSRLEAALTRLELARCLAALERHDAAADALERARADLLETAPALRARVDLLAGEVG